MFRPYTDQPPEQTPSFSEDEVRHQAGSTARRPITRSLVQPRKLFQEEISQLRAMETDEEAETEIEQHIATPSSRKAHRQLTPPTTVRKTTRRKLNTSHSPG